MTTLTPAKPASKRSTSKTNSRSGARPKPFTLEHFRVYSSNLILDNGEPWVLEDFQEEIIADIFAGYSEVWAVVGEGNAKTTLLGGLSLYYGDFTDSAFIPIGASSREQAEIMYRQAEGFVYRSPAIRQSFKCQEGYRRIKCLRTGGRIQVYAADDRTADGIIPGGIAICDELHRHRDLRLYRTWKGKLDKRGAQIIAISTAGEPESEFEETRARIRKNATSISANGCHTRAASEDLVLHDWAIPSRKQMDDMEVVAQANPLSTITPELLAKKRASDTMTDAHWLRFVCNIATRVEGQAVLPEDWDALEDHCTSSPGAPKFGFVDLGWRIDTTGVGVLSWESSDRRLILSPKEIEPPVDESDVVTAILDLHVEYDPKGFVYDPNAGGQQMAQLLMKGEHPLQRERGIGPITFFEHSQDNAPMADAAVKLEEAIRNGWIRHDGNPDLRRHVLNAVRKSLGADKWKYDRPSNAQGAGRRKFPIDLLTGVLIANRVAMAETDKPAPAAAFIY
jgi:phage terminase large subunit-like protein